MAILPRPLGRARMLLGGESANGIRTNLAPARGVAWIGERLPILAYAAIGALMGFSLGMALGQFGGQSLLSSRQCVARECGICSACMGRPLLGFRNFGILFAFISVVMLFIKHTIMPVVVPPSKFQHDINVDKYYGFCAQVIYHVVLAALLLTTVFDRSRHRLYHLATLAEPAYCTLDVVLLFTTGASFTHWDLKPLLIHHTISCACTHALMYGIPSSIYGNLLQFVFHSSSAICLGIANALVTPELPITSRGRLFLQVIALVIWTATRGVLVLILGLCVMVDVHEIKPASYWPVLIELNAAAIGSFVFVIIKTPILLKALRESIAESQTTQASPAQKADDPEQQVPSTLVEAEPQSSCNMHDCVMSWGLEQGGRQVSK